jgi:hypothetical protein
MQTACTGVSRRTASAMYGSCTVLTGEWGYERRMREEEGGHECPRGVLKFFRDEETGNSTPPNDHRTLFRLKKSRVGKESKKEQKRKMKRRGYKRKRNLCLSLLVRQRRCFQFKIIVRHYRFGPFEGTVVIDSKGAPLFPLVIVPMLGTPRPARPLPLLGLPCPPQDASPPKP